MNQATWNRTRQAVSSPMLYSRRGEIQKKEVSGGKNPSGLFFFPLWKEPLLSKRCTHPICNPTCFSSLFLCFTCTNEVKKSVAKWQRNGHCCLRLMTVWRKETCSQRMSSISGWKEHFPAAQSPSANMGAVIKTWPRLLKP